MFHNRLLEINTQNSNTWQPPDPGFLAAYLINDSDIESTDMVDFDASSDENSSPGNPFINFEAEEASESEPEEPVLNWKALLDCVTKFNSARKTVQVLILHGFTYLVLI